MVSTPFPGSKRLAYKKVREIFVQGGYDTVLEPFGGSGVLSANLVNDGLVGYGRAIVNDYDFFLAKFPKFLELKDAVVSECLRRGLRRTIERGKDIVEIERDGKRTPVRSAILQGKKRKILQDTISELVPRRYWRYFSLGSNFTYSSVSSHDTVELTDFCKFSNRLETDKQREFIKVFESIGIDHLDWRDFLEKHRDRCGETCLLIVDPPYPGTRQGQYRGAFDDDDMDELVGAVLEIGCDFIFFGNDLEDLASRFSDYELTEGLTGSGVCSANRKRKDAFAYVRR